MTAGARWVATLMATTTLVVSGVVRAQEEGFGDAQPLVLSLENVAGVGYHK